ncbi:DDRGK domain-containing protein 1-like [Olea europaea var. sylvestris]|uniref:DDRGK domain-containing protein 1-like n=1 Tax=Olea europaea var. sylvestris TaxID=158386 RepID=UPI000C1CD0B6|nr:DDRGK domain-containing protein 1-like [Olea europaea var. sylvestris]
MEDIVVGLLMMMLLLWLIPLYLWKRRVDSRSPYLHEEETQASESARESRRTKQDHYDEIRRKKDEEHEARERMLVG